MKATEFIYFDLGKVILNFSHEKACQQMADVANIGFQLVWQTVFDAGLQTRYETGLIDGEEFCQEFCRHTDSTPTCDDLLRAYSHIFTLNLPVVPILNELVAIDFPRGILSNTCAAHWEHVIDRYPAARDYFPQRVLSYEAKSMKPDRAIYDAAIELAGVDPQRIFFTDDRAENVEGAVAAGIDAVLFKSAVGLSKHLRKRGLDI